MWSLSRHFRLRTHFDSKNSRLYHSNQGQNRKIASVVFVRHGQSLWNKIPTFSGWCDVPLTQHGIEQAQEAGALLKQRGYNFEIAYTSRLQRAQRTCETILEELDEEGEIDMIPAWQLNERHYGSLQGRAKDDPNLLSQYGEETIRKWRREFHSRPPAMSMSHPYYEPPPAPLTESLADCQARILEFWNSTLVPSLGDGRSALVVAHANTIRAIIAYLDEVSTEDVVKIHVANCVPCVYNIDLVTGHAVDSEMLRTKFSSKGHWLMSDANRERLVQKLGRNSDSFARSLFNAWDKNGDGVLSREEIKVGLYSWKNDDPSMSAVVGKVWEELNKGDDEGPVTLEKFRRYALQGAKKHNLPFFL